MNFTSLIFFIFLPIVIFLHWIIPHKFRWIILLIASYFFYAYLNPLLIFLILFTTLITYIESRLIEKIAKYKKVFLISGVLIIFITLFIFKYLNFVLDLTNTINSFFNKDATLIEPLNVILPVGISFYTFQTAGYLIDVYKGKIQAEKHLGYYALFISFFPQLVAGPIEKTDKLLPQIKQERFMSFDNFSHGLKYFVSGFVKKILIADFLSTYVNNIYNNVALASGIEIIIATFLFGIVIYCDFSGYSEIAIGCAKWMGVDLTINFNRPYLSSSLGEFWNRWHVTLNAFFTDYIYIPLGGSRKGKFRKYLNIMIVFLVSGIWHGASLHFFLWGVICGFFLVLENIIKPHLDKVKINVKLKKVISIVITYLIINFCWIFFRAQNLIELQLIFSKIFTSFATTFDATFFTTNNIIYLILCLFILPLVYYLPKIDLENKNCYSIIALYVVLIIVVSLAYVNNLNTVGESSFIYFQF